MTTETPTEVLNDAEMVAAVLHHKYNLGTKINHDPGMEYSKNDFFANGHYERFCRELQKHNLHEKFKQARKLSVSLAKKGKIRELVEAGELPPVKNDIYAHVINLIHENGWVHEFERQRSLPERNQIYFFDVKVRKQGTSRLLEILGKEFGNVMGHAYCDIYLENKNGKYDLFGKKCARLGESNPEFNYGDNVRGFAYGRDAHCLETRLEANLVPREMTEAEAKEIRIWSSAHCGI